MREETEWWGWETGHRIQPIRHSWSKSLKYIKKTGTLGREGGQRGQWSRGNHRQQSKTGATLTMISATRFRRMNYKFVLGWDQKWAPRVCWEQSLGGEYLLARRRTWAQLLLGKWGRQGVMKEGKEKIQTNRVLKEVGTSARREAGETSVAWSWRGVEERRAVLMWQRTAGRLGPCTKHRGKRVFWNLSSSSEETPGKAHSLPTQWRFHTQCEVLPPHWLPVGKKCKPVLLLSCSAQHACLETCRWLK